MGCCIDHDCLGSYYLDNCYFDIDLDMSFGYVSLYNIILTSEESSSMLASIGSTASGLTSVILIVVVIISIFISVLLLLYLCWRGVWLLLWLFAFLSSSIFSFLWFNPFERLRNICFFFIIRMSDVRVQAGNCCTLSQSRQCSCWWITFLMMCSNSYAFLVVFVQFSQVMRCV